MKAQLTPEEEQSPAHIFIFMSLKGKKERKLSSLVEPLGKEASAFGMDIRKRKGQAHT